MRDYFYLNPSKMQELSVRLTGAEIKMLFAIMYCLSQEEATLFINNKKNRDRMKEIDFNKTSERTSMLLSSLVKKDALIKEANALYRLPDDLFLLPKEIEK